MTVVGKAKQRGRIYLGILVKQTFRNGCGGVNWIELAWDRTPCWAVLNIV
jgi:hypothetical protein